MATFRGHLRKKKASIKSGVSQSDVYRPIWFLFNQMESFLGKVNECNVTLNTEEVNKILIIISLLFYFYLLRIIVNKK